MCYPTFKMGNVKCRTLYVLCVSLKQRITTATASVEKDMLRSVWTELDYCVDICRVTKGSHIEHL
jgi:hypothetical protein